MKIKLKEITVKELAEGYKDNAEDGIVGYGGKLDIRPPYQREFVYNDKQRESVIETIMENGTLNFMHWASGNNKKFEILDGQQRTISICQYVNNEFSYKNMGFTNLQDDQRKHVLDHKLNIAIYKGNNSEKLKTFKKINTQGEKLNSQEQRNAVYSGTWITEAKRYFSKKECPAYSIGGNYLKGKSIRQDYLETAIKWISKGAIEEYMGEHQHDENANALWEYFQNVINWVSTIFIENDPSMKGVNWGSLYDEYKNKKYDVNKIKKEMEELLLDEDIVDSGIYPYILTRNEKYLSIRSFNKKIKRKIYKKQNGNCAICKKHFEISEMEADHIIPWSEGGKTNEENCQILCKNCNRRKSNK